MKPLTAEDIAEILVWVASRPPHVNIDELIVKPVDQAAMHKVYRRNEVSKLFTFMTLHGRSIQLNSTRTHHTVKFPDWRATAAPRRRPGR